MFNRLILAPQHHHRTERVTEHIHEHRAPTDESVQLLAEMEAAARDKIVEAVHVGDTTFECVIHMERSFVDDSTRLMAVFSMNGKRMTAEHIAKHRPEFDRKAAFVALRDAIATKIATEALIPALQQMEFSHGRTELTTRSR